MRIVLSAALSSLAFFVTLFPTSVVAAQGRSGSSEDFTFTGTIQKLPSNGLLGDWTVGDRIVRVSSSTKIEQERALATVGATVEVEGTPNSDGSVAAKEIKVLSGPGSGGGAYIKFYGTVESLPPAASGLIGVWKVSGRTVHVTPNTNIKQEKGPITVGAMVEVEGRQQGDGSVTASEVGLEKSAGGGSDDTYIEFVGQVESLPSGPGFIGDWKVSGRTVRVTSSTFLDQHNGAPKVGSVVEVKGASQSDGGVTASRIEVKDGSGGGGSSDDSTHFYGSVESLPGTSDFVGDWRVGGKVVHVSSATYLDRRHGAPAVGVYVEVEGATAADGSTNASKIEIKERHNSSSRVEFFGIVEVLPGTTGNIGDWKVSGRIVQVTSETRIKRKGGPIAVGSRVEIKGAEAADNSVNATSIKLEK